MLCPVDPWGNESGIGVEPTVQIDIPGLVKYLKIYQEGPMVVEALRRRTMIHWLYPEKDPLSNQVLGAYKKIAELLDTPTSILDVGCMCGYFKHYLDLHAPYHFRYIGIDRWPEAIQVAKEFFPRDDFRVLDILFEDGLFSPNTIDYVCVNNINFGKDVPKVIEKAVYVARKAAIFGMPKHCPNHFEIAKELGFENVEQFDCGESTVVKVNVNGNNHIRAASDGM